MCSKVLQTDFESTKTVFRAIGLPFAAGIGPKRPPNMLFGTAKSVFFMKNDDFRHKFAYKHTFAQANMLVTSHKRWHACYNQLPNTAECLYDIKASISIEIWNAKMYPK